MSPEDQHQNQTHTHNIITAPLQAEESIHPWVKLLITK